MNLKVSPEGEGFRPNARTMKVIRLSATDQLTTSSVYYSFKGATTDEGALLRNRLEDILLIAMEK